MFWRRWKQDREAFERAFLEAIQQEPFGVSTLKVRQEVERLRGVTVSIGAVYATMDRLQRRKLVETWEAPGGPERGYRAQRMVRLTEAGKQALAGG